MRYLLRKQHVFDFRQSKGLCLLFARFVTAWQTINLFDFTPGNEMRGVSRAFFSLRRS